MSKKTAEDLNPTDKGKLDELSLEIYEARVRDLTEKLVRSKEKCELLGRENDALGRAQTKFSSDKQDIVEFLNIKVREHEEHITVLEAKIQKLEDEKRALEAKAKQDIENTIADWKKELDGVQNLSSKYKGELDMLFDFKGKKDDLERNLRQALALLETREKEYKDVIHTMERKVLQDKNHMKKEMLQKVNEAVTNFRRVADQQMAETTKRAIRENMAITSQIKKMSARTLELIAENEAFKTKVEKLKTSNALLTESEKELAKKNQANQRVIKMLLDRLKESDEMLELAYEQNAEKDNALPEESDLKERGESQFNNNNSSSAEDDVLFEELKSEYGRLLGDLTDLERLVLDLEEVEPEQITNKIDAIIHETRANDSLKFRLLQLFSKNSYVNQEASPERPTSTKTRRKHAPMEKQEEVDISAVISAIPKPSRYNTAEPIRTNSVSVQTLPIILQTLGEGSNLNLNNPTKNSKVMTLLSEVRPWGNPAQSFPKKDDCFPSWLFEIPLK
ncbi:hypothetical protein BCR33DRAFT_852751 [Rhizoclosmatium globosum]|uniref:Cilia- and flagella-associated protein 157 n=1 Tax=Rhizoclosmatium globosum TaxID=329046 RepID=A0A1Y2C0I6_9FUNG|nr:hypothetical protein BCR33DRAFT_852751 [Rhizoclosmatium globosum]|eukprot:ORY40424.1 hypothetical protein BCR33DRAFT_852751 [Rhizoclosmatium globosum]